VFGLIAGLLVYLIDLASASTLSMSPWGVGLVVGVGLAGACLAGTVLGVASPLLFMRIRVDPAVASGPIVTACNDFLSMTIYFLIAWGLGGLLV
jgi:magnesium transporter